MSLASAKEFLSKVDLDTDFYLKLGEALSLEERWELVRGSGFDFNKEELTQAMGDLDAGKMTQLFLMGWGNIFGDIPRLTISTCGTCE